MVAAIYDVSFVAHPEWFGWREGMRRRLLTGLTAHRAARVLTTSEFSKGEIHRRLGVRVDRINVVYPGTTALADGPAEGHGEQLVLFVGSLFTRRHVPELIQAFAGLAGARDNLRLEIVGDNRTTPRVDFDRLVASTGVADRMTLRSYVPDDLLATLYRRACAFVFLSEYEGFGLTPLEALGAGVPILVLDTPIAREVYGEAALYVPSADPAIVRSALERVLSDAELRARLRDAAGPVLARYSWDTCARQVLNVLLSAAR
jgi:glycosyltransferase involved in cell wall biosynthesis